MKKLVLVMCMVSLLAAGCSSDKVINGKEYKTYGLINQEDNKAANIKYKPCWGNIVWGCILIETIIGPIYFFGFDMFEPDSSK